MTKAEPAGTADQAVQANGESDAERHDRPIARFVQEHPGMTIAGGVALGVLAAALLPKRNREFVAGKSTALADLVSAAGLMLYREALERGGAASEGIREIAGRLGHTGAPGAEAPGASASEDGEGPSGRFDLADALAGVARHLRGRSRD